MKKSLLIIIIIFIISLFFIFGIIMTNNSINTQIKRDNHKYEIYLEREVNGVDVATIINKATEENKKNKVPKDEKGRYIDNGEDSIRIDIKMATVENTYPMETIVDNDITFFVQNFNLIEFKCTTIEYHKKTGRVSKLIFEEIEELSY